MQIVQEVRELRMILGMMKSKTSVKSVKLGLLRHLIKAFRHQTIFKLKWANFDFFKILLGVTRFKM